MIVLLLLSLCPSQLSGVPSEKSMYYDAEVQLNVQGSMNRMHPLSFATQTASNEAYFSHQAMQQDNREAFLQGMKDKIKAHEDNHHWKLVRQSEIGP